MPHLPMDFLSSREMRFSGHMPLPQRHTLMTRRIPRAAFTLIELLDAYDQNAGRWGQFGRSGCIDRSNHWQMNGENIVFVDGHGEWRTAAQIAQNLHVAYDGGGSASQWFSW